MKKLICIFIDALNQRFISKEHTPFLFSLSQKYKFLELETLLGFSDAIDASLFTGTYPDTNDYWMKFEYNPKKSIFKEIPITYPLKILDYMPSYFSLIKSGINYGLYHTVYKHFSNKYGYDTIASFNMPYKIIHQFDFTLKKPLTGNKPFKKISTVFDLIREDKKSFYYTHGFKKDTINMLKKSDLGIVYLSEIDATAHLFGVDSPRFYNTLSILDKKVELLFKKFNDDPDTNFLIFSDHGMANVDKILSFRYLLKRKDFNNRFLLTLDGTMIRFWYFDDSIKSIIHDILAEEKRGHFLDKFEKERFRINFSHNKYGEDVFLLDQGAAIFPNFFSWAKPEAMHSYDPSHKEQRGIVLVCNVNSDNSDLPFARPVDITPTILDYFEIEIPSFVEGKSLLG